MQFPKYTHRKARIEIVPMIDTIFFLLVYFMIASLSMTKTPAKVDLPTSKTASERHQAMIIVTVAKNGQCYLDQNAIAMTSLKSGLESRLAQDSNTTVLINCDKNQSVASFNHVFDLVKQSNPISVMVATTPRAPETSN